MVGADLAVTDPRANPGALQTEGGAGGDAGGRGARRSGGVEPGGRWGRGGRGSVGRAEFLAELDTIRARGYSQAHGEREPGMASVAAPVPHPAGATAATQVSGTRTDIPEDRVPQFGVELQRAALAIARRIS